MTEPHRILIVAEDASQRKFVVRALEHQELQIESAENCESAFRQLLDGRFAAVVIDLAASREAIELIKQIRATPELSETRVLVTSEWGDGLATLAFSQGVDGYEPAPLDERRLIDSVERMLGQRAVVIE